MRFIRKLVGWRHISAHGLEEVERCLTAGGVSIANVTCCKTYTPTGPRRGPTATYCSPSSRTMFTVAYYRRLRFAPPAVKRRSTSSTPGCALFPSNQTTDEPKRRQIALQKTVFWRAFCRLLKAKIRQIGKPLTINGLQTGATQGANGGFTPLQRWQDKPWQTAAEGAI